ncbi:MAG: serine/threonine protein kinase [Deltaproteobacteria bacterium]|nr:MAG: serine/threonine protein kinase [Deltaproteobacteria bacterium]
MAPDVDTAEAAQAGPTAAGRLAPGTTLGGFRVDHLARRTSVGEVYRARGEDGAPVELYVVAADLLAGPEVRARIEQAIARAAALHHKNVAGVSGLTTAGDIAYAVGEFVDGTPLADLLAQKRAARTTFSPKSAYNVVAHLCNALSAIHAAGLAHGHLHPGNVVVERSGRVKLTELGFADPRAIGTGPARPYAAPEVVGGGAATPAADIYSLGAILYELLTGTAPRPGAQPPSKVVPALGAAVDAVVIRAVHPNPANRWPDAAQFKQALQRAIDAAPRASAGQPAAKRPSLAQQLTGDQRQALASAAPAAADDTVEKWLVSKGKLDYGPFTLAQVIRQIETDEILPGHILIDNETGERTPVENHPLLADIVDRARQARDDRRRAEAEQQQVRTETRRGATLYAFIGAGALALGIGVYFLVHALSAADAGGDHGQVAAIREGELQAKITFMKPTRAKGKARRRSGGRARPSAGGAGAVADEFDGPLDLGDVSEDDGDTERLDDSDINPVIARHGGALAACLRKHGGGRAHVQFVIRGNGRVSFSKVNGETGTGLARCIDRVMKKMAFPAFNGPRTRAEFELSF